MDLSRCIGMLILCTAVMGAMFFSSRKEIMNRSRRNPSPKWVDAVAISIVFVAFLAVFYAISLLVMYGVLLVIGMEVL